jgi:hypothetical protein
MTTSEEFVACVGCGALVPDTDGANHAYLGCSPGCWAIFREVLAREYSDYQYASVHNLSVDAYAIQHPATQSPKTIQSAAVHLISLYFQLEQGYPSARAARAKQEAIQHRDKFAWLEPPASLGAITVLDVHAAQDAASHIDMVSQWARGAWEAWQEYHETVRHWAAL